MGRATENDLKSLAKIDPRIRVEVLYKYLVEGKNQSAIAEEVFSDYSDWGGMRVSMITRSYGFHRGKGRGEYRSVSRDTITDFVRMFRPEFRGALDKGAFDTFLRGRPQQVYEPQVRTDYQPQSNYQPRSDYQPESNGYSDVSYDEDRSYHHSSYSRAPVYVDSYFLRRLAPIFVAFAVLLLLWGGSKTFHFGWGSFGNQVSGFWSAEYDAEAFRYEGLEYIGNRRFNKPSGPCVRLDSSSQYTMAYFNGAELDGHGMIVKNRGSDLEIGEFKNSKLHGYAILRCNGVNFVAKFKKGIANGYGYCYNNGTEQLVKFEKLSAQAPDLSAVSVVAERSGDTWYKPNGKVFKLKDNTYKGITWLRDGYICIDDMEFYFNAQTNESSYTSSDADFTWTSSFCEGSFYQSENEFTTFTYNFGGELEGYTQYKKRGQWFTNTFSAYLSVT